MSDYDTWLSTNPNEAHSEKELAQNVECDCGYADTIDVEVSLSRYSIYYQWTCPDCKETHEVEGDYAEDDFADDQPDDYYDE
jgi:hypothetical protein